MNKKISKLGILLTLLFSTMYILCGIQESGWEGTIEEQNGIIIVKNPDNPIYKKDILILEEELSLGKKQGEKEYMFSRVMSIDIDKDENIYILDKASEEVRVYNKQGKFLRSFGSRGQGPGEFQNPRFIQILNNQEIIVWDSSSRRFLVFSLAGEYLRQISTARLAFPLDPVKWDKRGNLIAFIMPPPVMGGTELVKLNEKFENLMTIGRIEKDNSYPKRESKVMRPGLSCAVFKDDSVIWVNSKKYELQILNPEGKLSRKIIRFCKPVKITERSRKELEEKYSRTSVGELKYKPIFPKHYPFFQDISVDEEGRIFILTFASPRKEERFYYLDIFDSGGRYIGKAPIKRRINGLFWKKKKLYLIERDEEGFNTVKRCNIIWKYK